MRKNCIICGKEFTVLGTSKTCGKECSYKNKMNIINKYNLNHPNTEKRREQSKKRWLEKKGITELSEKGIKANKTKQLNIDIKNEIDNCSTKCLLEEFGDIE